MVKSFIRLAHDGKRKYHGNLPWYFHNSKCISTAVNYLRIFITLASVTKRNKLLISIMIATD